MNELRKPFLIAAVVISLLIVMIEIGAGATIRGNVRDASSSLTSTLDGFPLPDAVKDALKNMDSGEADQLADAGDSVPGSGIPYLAVVDSLLFFMLLLLASPLAINEELVGKLQGCVTCVVSFLIILASIVMIIIAIVLVFVMIALFLAVPFGTIAYLAIYGFFNRPAAMGVLSLLMFLKFAVAVCLLLAQQEFLQNSGLIRLIICSLVANVIVIFLQGLVPIFLVSITDDIAGIIVALGGCICWLAALIGAIPAVLRAVSSRN